MQLSVDIVADWYCHRDIGLRPGDLPARARGPDAAVLQALAAGGRPGDDLVLCTESAADMNGLMTVVSNFCRWSGMRLKLEKSVASAFDFGPKEELSTGEILL